MDIENLHSYYLEHGIRAASKKAKMRAAKLQKLFEDAGLMVRRQVDVDKKTVELWYEMYKSGSSLPEIEETVGSSIKRIARAFRLYNFPLKTKEQIQQQKAEKIKNTNLERYGVENVMQVSSVVERLKDSVNNRTDEQLRLTDDKRKKTVLSRYGKDYYVTTEDFKQKSESTFIKTYGTTTASLVPAIIKKRTLTHHNNKVAKLKPYLITHGYELLDEYAGNRVSTPDGEHVCWKRYRLKHTCGTVFEDDVFEMPRCPSCYPLNTSVAEVYLRDYIKSLGVEVVSNDRTKIRNPDTGRFFELDIFLPEYDIAFEYNGVYTHRNKPSHYHKNKSDLCSAVGIKLYHVWEHQNPEIVKSRIKCILSKDVTKLYARNLNVKKISNRDANDFLRVNHLQGGVGCCLAFGLFNVSSLISVITFRKMSEEDIEIARYCTTLGTKVTGGFSKLLKFALPTIQADFPLVKKIVTYADRDWSPSTDTVYSKNGFSFVGCTEEGLYYFNENDRKVYSRLKYQKYKLKSLFPDAYSEGLTAQQILLAKNIFPLYTSGNWKYVKIL
jgi:uncharacterized UPF0146 family protein